MLGAVGFKYTKNLNPKRKETIMFNKNKKPTEIRPAAQKSKGKPGVVVNKDAANKPRDNKDSKQEKSDMRSEGGKN